MFAAVVAAVHEGKRYTWYARKVHVCAGNSARFAAVESSYSMARMADYCCTRGTSRQFAFSVECSPRWFSCCCHESYTSFNLAVELVRSSAPPFNAQ